MALALTEHTLVYPWVQSSLTPPPPPPTHTHKTHSLQTAHGQTTDGITPTATANFIKYTPKWPTSRQSWSEVLLTEQARSGSPSHTETLDKSEVCRVSVVTNSMPAGRGISWPANFPLLCSAQRRIPRWRGLIRDHNPPPPPPPPPSQLCSSFFQAFHFNLTLLWNFCVLYSSS